MVKGPTEVILDPLGFYRIAALPTVSELNDYYSSTYYQNPHGTYQESYTTDELEQLRQKFALRLSMVGEEIFGDGKRIPTFLDVGCGEGWFLQYMQNEGFEVSGLDFSKFGVEKHNPKLVPNVTQGDIHLLMQQLIDSNQSYDLLFLGNILEHVLDPELVMRNCLKLLSPDGGILITVPNDFSILQNSLLENKNIQTAYWVSPPDHLNYFTSNSLKNFLSSIGLEVLKTIADFPIDWFLANRESNYVTEPSKGKNAHAARTFLETLINQNNDPYRALTFWESLAEIGHGRTITTFAKLKRTE